MALTTVVRLAVRGNAVVPVVTFRWILLVLSISCSAACGGETRVEACDARILSGPVARGAYYMSNFAIDTCNAYGIDATAGALWRESITGGDRVTLGASASTGFAQSAMANSTHAFWNDGGLKRVSHQGSGVETVFSGSLNSGIVVDEEHAALTVSSDAQSGVAGLIEVELRTGMARTIAPDIWALSLVRSGSDFFGSTCGPPGVWRVSAIDGTISELVSNAFCATEVEVLDGRVYYAAGAGGPGYALSRVPVGGGDPNC